MSLKVGAVLFLCWAAITLAAEPAPPPPAAAKTELSAKAEPTGKTEAGALPPGPVAAPGAAASPALVYVIPVRGEIEKPVLYVVRRGLKEAIEHKATAVVLDMDTPGGAGDVTLELMEALDKFPGLTITYVDTDAISAGAFIAAATREIWFAPKGVIGASAAVTSGGQDIPETMRLKVTSFMRAKVRAFTEGRGHRGPVVEAMIDKDYELKIGDKVIKPKGELLSRTATEAMEKYGEPPEPLLGAGIARDIDEILEKKFGRDGYQVKQFEVTWSERLAQYLTMSGVSSVLMGAGLLALFIEFKMPGHGWIGGVGVVLLGLVFFGSYVSGLSGHEPVLFFGLGLVLLAVEIFFFPGTILLGVAGILLMLGSLVWSMSDIWPNQPIGVSADALVQPLGSVGLGLALAVIGGAAIIRFLPKGWVWNRLVVGATVGSSAQSGGAGPEAGATLDSLVGRHGRAATALRPGGQIEIDGTRYEAKVAVGAIDAGAGVVVRGRSDFSLIVEAEGA